MWRHARVLCGFALGLLPGVLLACFVDVRIGLAIGILGPLVGAVLALPGVSIQRVLLALFGIAIDRTAPPMSHLIDVDAADAGIPVQDDDLSIHILRWLVMPRVKRRRNRLVLCGVVIGGLIGLALGTRDVWLWFHHRTGVIIPLAMGEIESDADVFAQLIIIAFAGSVWGGSLVAIFASQPWRRSILFAAGFGAFLSGMIALAVSKPGEYRWDLMIPFATIAAAFALVFFPLVDLQIFNDRASTSNSSIELMDEHSSRP